MHKTADTLCICPHKVQEQTTAETIQPSGARCQEGAPLGYRDTHNNNRDIRTVAEMPDEKAKKRHLDNLEKGLKEQYTPRMKKLTLRQGKLLIKLVDRECNQNAYQLIKLFMGSFKAAFYNTFASLFGASLKKTYDPQGEDWLIEQVVVRVINGQL